MQDYSIWYLQYGFLRDFPEFLALSDGRSTGRYAIPHGYVYLEGNGHRILVDTGWGNANVLTESQPPAATLGTIGVKPEEIDTVLLTHAHRDHAGNTDAFPNAHFYLQSRELIESIKLLALPKSHSRLFQAINAETIARLVHLSAEGRLSLLEGDALEILPGIDAFAAFDTHSPGHQFFRVHNAMPPEKSWVCCGDLIFSILNLTGLNNDGIYIPIANGGPDCRKLFKAYDKMLGMTHGDASRVIATHGREIHELFPSRMWKNNLHIVEIQRADGLASRL